MKNSSERLAYPIYLMRICYQDIALENSIANVQIETTFWLSVSLNIVMEMQKMCYDFRVLKETRTPSVIQPSDFNFTVGCLEHWKKRVQVCFNLKKFRRIRITVMCLWFVFFELLFAWFFSCANIITARFNKPYIKLRNVNKQLINHHH